MFIEEWLYSIWEGNVAEWFRALVLKTGGGLFETRLTLTQG